MSSISHPKITLQGFTNSLLSDDTSWGEKRQAVHDIAQLFAKLGTYDINTENKQKGAAASLEHGYAIGSWGAAMCLLEVKRTCVFVKGIIAAIHSLQQKKTDIPIHILDAGCGPFALLSVLPALYIEPEAVQFHLIDIIPENIIAVKKLIEVLGMQAYFGDLFVADATKFAWNKAEPLSVIISETMLNALRKEPQVAITLNLSPQLAPEGIFIPESIQVDLYAVNNRLKQKYMLSSLADNYLQSALYENLVSPIMVLNKITRFDNKYKADLTTIQLTENYNASIHSLEFYTTIKVFGEYILERNDSSITLSYPLVKNGQEPVNEGKELFFWYEINEQPGIRWMVNSAQ